MCGRSPEPTLFVTRSHGRKISMGRCEQARKQLRSLRKQQLQHVHCKGFEMKEQRRCCV